MGGDGTAVWSTLGSLVRDGSVDRQRKGANVGFKGFNWKSLVPGGETSVRDRSLWYEDVTEDILRGGAGHGRVSLGRSTSPPWK